MKIRLKLGLPLIFSLLIVVSTALGWLGFNTSSQIKNLSQENENQIFKISQENEKQILDFSQENEKQMMNISQAISKNFEKFEIKAAEDIFKLINANLSKTIKMGNKRGLPLRLKRQKVGNIKEISVFNSDGKVKFSSDQTFIGKEITPEIMEDILGNKQKITRSDGKGNVEIYAPQVVTRKCTMCHIHQEWRGKEGMVGGITYAMISTSELYKFKSENQMAMASHVKVNKNMVDRLKSKNQDGIVILKKENKQIVSGITDSVIKSSIVILLVIVIILFVAIALLVKGIVISPINRVLGFAEKLEKGDLSAKLPNSSDEFGEMASALNNFVDGLDRRADAAAGIAAGNLRQEINVVSDEDKFGKALKRMVLELNRMVNELKTAGEQVNAGAIQVSDMSQSLSQGATNQASSLEEITGSMDEIASQTKANAENATQANQLTRGARDSASEGIRHMSEMTASMGNISEAGKEISKIIKTIDDIAFQTNLLALNAAVEAARAGKHGKGFAVVAQEVRSLAARSAKAAQETAELIDGTLKKVEDGNIISEKTASALEEINERILKASDIIGEIAIASNEQAQSVSQVNHGLSRIDGVTQQNSANAEETASAAEELSDQASQVQSLLTSFMLKTELGGIPASKHELQKSEPIHQIVDNSGDQTLSIDHEWGDKNFRIEEGCKAQSDSFV